MTNRSVNQILDAPCGYWLDGDDTDFQSYHILYVALREARAIFEDIEKDSCPNLHDEWAQALLKKWKTVQ